MKATIQLTIDVELGTEQVKPDVTEVPGARGPDAPVVHVMRNEAAVLKARRQAAKDAEAIGRDLVKSTRGATGFAVVEVSD